MFSCCVWPPPGGDSNTDALGCSTKRSTWIMTSLRQPNQEFTFAVVDAFHKPLGGLSSSLGQWSYLFHLCDNATGITFAKQFSCKSVSISTITIVPLFFYFTAVE